MRNILWLLMAFCLMLVTGCTSTQIKASAKHKKGSPAKTTVVTKAVPVRVMFAVESTRITADLKSGQQVSTYASLFSILRSSGIEITLVAGADDLNSREVRDMLVVDNDGHATLHTKLPTGYTSRLSECGKKVTISKVVTAPTASRSKTTALKPRPTATTKPASMVAPKRPTTPAKPVVSKPAEKKPEAKPVDKK